MTLADGSNSFDLAEMLRLAVGCMTGAALRLFLVACCGRILPLLTDDRSRMAIEESEKFARGLASEEDLASARCAAEAARAHARQRMARAKELVFNAFDAVAWQDAEMFWLAAVAAHETTRNPVAVGATRAAMSAAWAAAISRLDNYGDWDAAIRGERQALCRLLRDAAPSSAAQQP